MLSKYDVVATDRTTGLDLVLNARFTLHLDALLFARGAYTMLANVADDYQNVDYDIFLVTKEYDPRAEQFVFTETSREKVDF